MEALEATMNKHNIYLDTSSTSSLRQTIYASIYASSGPGCALSDSSYSSSSHEWLIDSGSSYHMGKEKAMFWDLDYCNTKNIYVGDDKSLRVVGFGIVHLDNVSLKMYYVFQLILQPFISVSNNLFR